MRKRSRKRPNDFNALAALIVSEATDRDSELKAAASSAPEKNAAAVALGRLGGKKGGAKRAASMTPEQRKEAARKAAEALAQHLHAVIAFMRASDSWDDFKRLLDRALPVKDAQLSLALEEKP
jgi:hypothetical protein